MFKAKIDKLLELISDIVAEPGPFTDKKARILRECDDSDKINLLEFTSWFDADD